MAFAISAYFPLGFYQGSDSGGRPEEFPSLCRLYSALVSVAYLTFGFEQVDANRNLTDDQIREALNWLEDNPPQGMLLPHAVKADSRAVAYRNKGNVQNRKKPKDKVSSTTAHIATAYEQHPESERLLTWIWHECPSSTARMVLSWLCNEVPYLGEACSPVELNTYEDYVLPSGVDEQLWTLSPDSALTNIRKRGKPVAYPKKGRLDDLKQAFVAANPKPKGKKNLTVSDKEDEQNFLNEYPLAQTEGKARYLSSAARKQREVLKAPWVMALYLEINAIACNGDIKNSSEWKPQESEFVNWAVALHRFLVKEWGIDPSPALVGKYAPGIARPANNVSIQIIDADFKQRYSQQIRDDVVKLNPGFLILIPSDMSKGDIGKLRDVCAGAEGKSLYYAPEKSTLRIGKVTTVDAEHFWKPVAPGMCRYWAVRPMAIAETRPIPDIKLHRKWGVYEALCLSIGHVWRSQYPQSSEGSREERYWNIVDAVSAKTSHFRIYNYRTVHRANMTDYVHRANGSNILHGMNALIAISDVGESLDCAAMAIGQSRHLGGGFLVPADFAVSVCQSDDDFEKGIPTWLK